MLVTLGPLSGNVAIIGVRRFCGEGNLHARGSSVLFWFSALDRCPDYSAPESRGTIIQISRDLVNRDDIEIRSSCSCRKPVSVRGFACWLA
jgi:hypothetical protein